MAQGGTQSRSIASQSRFFGKPPPQASGHQGPGSTVGVGGGGGEPKCPLRATLNSAGELSWGVDETLAQLEKVLHLYRSGQYLQNSTAGSQAGEWPL